MIVSRLRTWVIQLPRPLFLVVRFWYRLGRELSRIPVWIYRLIKYHVGDRSPDLPVVGLHTVFIAKENILFLKEWILYHRLKGIEHFFLYDNSGVTRSSALVESSPHTIHGRVTKYGVPYDEIVRMSPEDVQDVLDEIEREIPEVKIVKWRPRDEDGKIMYAQIRAQNDALERYGRQLVDWMVFMDMDEYLVSDESVPELCRWLESRGYDGGLMSERVMPTRLDNVDRYVIENNTALNVPYPVGIKYLCATRHTLHANVHSFTSLSRQHRFDQKRAFFLHYKMPSLHPDMRGKFEEAESSIDPALTDALKEASGRYCDPRWRLSKVHPDWRRMMGQINPKWHLEERAT